MVLVCGGKVDSIEMLTIITNINKLRINRMKLKLSTFSCKQITQGSIYINYEFICFTVEPPWKNNKVNISCIPAGTYKIKRVNSPKFGYTYEITDVDGRTEVLFHKGNTVSNTYGCILPCQYFGFMGASIAGYNSKKAYDKLMCLLGDDEHELEISRYGV